jgi:hypothetical protein
MRCTKDGAAPYSGVTLLKVSGRATEDMHFSVAHAPYGSPVIVWFRNKYCHTSSGISSGPRMFHIAMNMTYQPIIQLNWHRRHRSLLDLTCSLEPSAPSQTFLSQVIPQVIHFRVWHMEEHVKRVNYPRWPSDSPSDGQARSTV